MPGTGLALWVALTLSAGRFGTASTLPGQLAATGEGPRMAAVGDLNGDGRPDLVVANSDSGDLSLLPGKGDGTYATGRRIAVGGAPAAVAIANLDGSRRTGLVFVDETGGTLGVLHPSGILGVERFPVGDGPVALALVRLNGDRYLDAIVANRGSQDLSVLPGTARGGFGPQVRLGLAAAPIGLAAGDFDRNGTVDLAVATAPSPGRGDLEIWLGNGDGTLTPSGAVLDLGSDGPVTSIASGDFDGDDNPDLALGFGGVGFSRPGGVGILMGDGRGAFAAGEFQLFPGIVPLVDGLSRVVIAAGDFDGDGADEIAAAADDAAFVPRSFIVIMEHGAPAMVPAGLSVPGDFARYGSGARFLAAADVNGDGHLDLSAVWSPALRRQARQGLVFSLLGNGDSTFTSRSFGPQITPSNSIGNYTETGDINGDGRPDLITGGPMGLTALLGDGSGGFDSVPVAGVRFPVVVADFDRDGYDDLVAGGDRSQIAFHRSRGDGTFEDPIAYPLPSFDDFIIDLESVDLNRDGRMDVLANVQRPIDPAQVRWEVAAWMGGGDGTFVAPVFSGSGLAAGNIATGDLDGDRIPDAVVSNQYGFPQSVEVLRGNGDGTFALADAILLDGAPVSAAIADVDGNHRADLIVATQYGSSGPGLWYLSGNGDATFDDAVALDIPAGTAPSDVIVASLDRRAPSIVAASSSAESSGLFVIRSRGGGCFEQPRLFAAPSSRDVAVADFDGDHRPDIAVASWSLAEVSVLLQLRAASVGPRWCGAGCDPAAVPIVSPIPVGPVP